MSSALAFAVVAAVVISVAATFVVRSAARRFHWLDHPSRRKMHSDPIPLLGGIAMYVAFIIAVPITQSRTVLDEGSVVLAGATLLLLVGAIDDRRGMHPLVKLLAQVTAAAVLVVGGVRVGFLPAEWMNIAATIVWIVGICNAMNLLDNMDGLSAGVAAIACAFFAVLAVIHGQIWVSIVAAVLLGAILGFLYFNWNPATIFMGDAGSLLLGFLLAVLALKLRFPGADPQRTWLIPILILGVPIFDTTLVTLSRLRRGVAVTSGGRDHVSHRLVRLGLTVRQAVSVMYLVAIICGLAAFAVILIPSRLAVYALVGLLGIAAILALIFLERVDLSDTGQVAKARPERPRLRVETRNAATNHRPGAARTAPVATMQRRR